MKPTKIVSLLLFFSPLLCFAETTGTTNEVPAIETEANLETSTDENLIEEIETNTTELNDNSLIIEDTKTEETSNSDISSEPKSDIDVTTKVEQEIRNDTNKNDSIISDLQSYYKLQEKYDSLRKELTIDKEAKRTEIQNKEEAAISEIENFPWTPDELDENGDPTTTALKYREDNIKAIKERFQLEYSAIEDENEPSETEEMLLVKTQMQSRILEITAKDYSYFDYLDNDIEYKTEKTFSSFVNNNDVLVEEFLITPTVNIANYPYLKTSKFREDVLTAEAIPSEEIEDYKKTGTFPFYSKAIFNIQYVKEDNAFIINFKNQIYYLVKDNSLVDISKLQSISSPEVPTKTEPSSIDSNTKQSETKPSKQHGRNGIYMDGTYGFGPYGNIFGARTQLLFGGKFVYAGLFATGQFHPIDEKFNSPYDNFIMGAAGAVLGATLTLWKFQPYVQLGVGYATPLINGNKTIDTFNANAEAGIDIHLSKFALGVFYKFDYFLDCGATDSFGISLGYRF